VAGADRVIAGDGGVEGPRRRFSQQGVLAVAGGPGGAGSRSQRVNRVFHSRTVVQEAELPSTSGVIPSRFFPVAP